MRASQRCGPDCQGLLAGEGVVAGFARAGGRTIRGSDDLKVTGTASRLQLEHFSLHLFSQVLELRLLSPDCRLGIGIAHIVCPRAEGIPGLTREQDQQVSIVGDGLGVQRNTSVGHGADAQIEVVTHREHHALAVFDRFFGFAKLRLRLRLRRHGDG